MTTDIITREVQVPASTNGRAAPVTRAGPDTYPWLADPVDEPLFHSQFITDNRGDREMHDKVKSHGLGAILSKIRAEKSGSESIANIFTLLRKGKVPDTRTAYVSAEYVPAYVPVKHPPPRSIARILWIATAFLFVVLLVAALVAVNDKNNDGIAIAIAVLGVLAFLTTVVVAWVHVRNKRPPPYTDRNTVIREAGLATNTLLKGRGERALDLSARADGLVLALPVASWDDMPAVEQAIVGGIHERGQDDDNRLGPYFGRRSPHPRNHKELILAIRLFLVDGGRDSIERLVAGGSSTAKGEKS